MLGNAHANAVRAMRRGTWDAWLARLQNICFDPAAVTPEMVLPLATAYAQPGAVESFERFMNARRDIELERPYRIIGRLAEIEAPTLVIWGKQEMRGDLDSARKAVREIPRGRLVTYDHCGHLPFLERVTRFNEDVRDFLRAGE
jgi:2-hydroxy-6-oxonona-2,4-dienedioate hydrolase